jgi:Tol biopolymer transport system component
MLKRAHLDGLPTAVYIAFDSIQAGSGDIYVVPVQGGRFVELQKKNSHENMASWSRDGKWIYFESDRSGDFEIWKTPSGSSFSVSRDGRRILDVGVEREESDLMVVDNYR